MSSLTVASNLFCFYWFSRLMRSVYFITSFLSFMIGIEWLGYSLALEDWLWVDLSTVVYTTLTRQLNCDVFSGFCVINDCERTLICVEYVMSGG